MANKEKDICMEQLKRKAALLKAKKQDEYYADDIHLAFKSFMKDVGTENKNTEIKYYGIFRRFCEVFEIVYEAKLMKISQLEYSRLIAIREALTFIYSEEMQKSGDTLRLHLRTMRRFFLFLKRNSFGEEHLFEYIKYYKVKKTIKTKTRKTYAIEDYEMEELYKEILKIPDLANQYKSDNNRTAYQLYKKMYLIFMIHICTPVRISECLNLKYGKIKRCDKDSYRMRLEFSTKGGKIHSLIAPNELGIIMEKYLKELCQNKKDDDSIFISDEFNEGKLYCEISSFLKKVSKKLELDIPLRPHRLRATFATNMLKNGHGLFEIQNALGHKDSKTTLVYLNRISGIDMSKYQGKLNIKTAVQSYGGS